MCALILLFLIIIVIIVFLIYYKYKKPIQQRNTPSIVCNSTLLDKIDVISEQISSTNNCCNTQQTLENQISVLRQEYDDLLESFQKEQEQLISANEKIDELQNIITKITLKVNKIVDC